MSKSTFRSLRTLPMLGVVLALPAFAHHSFAGYDTAKTLTAPATIKEFRWGAPHSAAVFIIKDASGNDQQITVASASPGMFIKQGFKPRDFKVGDKLELSWHPTKIGKPGGIASKLKLADGRVFADQEALSQANVNQLGEPTKPTP